MLWFLECTVRAVRGRISASSGSNGFCLMPTLPGVNFFYWTPDDVRVCRNPKGFCGEFMRLEHSFYEYLGTTRDLGQKTPTAMWGYSTGDAGSPC